jgi:hypothetical protein
MAEELGRHTFSQAHDYKVRLNFGIVCCLRRLNQVCWPSPSRYGSDRGPAEL